MRQNSALLIGIIILQAQPRLNSISGHSFAERKYDAVPLESMSAGDKNVTEAINSSPWQCQKLVRYARRNSVATTAGRALRRRLHCWRAVHHICTCRSCMTDCETGAESCDSLLPPSRDAGIVCIQCGSSEAAHCMASVLPGR